MTDDAIGEGWVRITETNDGGRTSRLLIPGVDYDLDPVRGIITMKTGEMYFTNNPGRTPAQRGICSDISRD